MRSQVVVEFGAPLKEVETPTPQPTRDGVPTLWVSPDDAGRVLRHLKEGVERPYRMLYDLTAIDERERRH